MCDWDVAGYKENLWDKTFLQYQFCQILQVPYFENESELLGSKKGSHWCDFIFYYLLYWCLDEKSKVRSKVVI